MLVTRTIEERQKLADKWNLESGRDPQQLKTLLEDKKFNPTAIAAEEERLQKMEDALPAPEPYRPAAPLMGSQRERNLKGAK